MAGANPQRRVSQPHDRINFNLRPNKRVERKLIAEAFACIYRYDNPRRFGYVGMGSYYFSDFVLFHRIFGIKQMFSIERDEGNKARFEFNRPFDCIEMRYGTTSDVLPGLEIFDAAPVICWLDYYDRLNSAILGDVDTVLTRAQPGSALVVTLNAAAFNGGNDVVAFFESLPRGVDTRANRQSVARPEGIGPFMLAQLEDRIQSTLLDVNENKQAAEKITARRVINIHYKDGIPMVTYGWLLLTPAQNASLDAAPTALDAPGVNLVATPLDVDTPVLTFREIAHLKALLPNGVDKVDFATNASPVSKVHAEKFAKFYRYYPNFADIEE